mgnify:CR=1 FL=1
MKRIIKKNPVVAVAQIKYFDISSVNNIEKIKRYIKLAKKKDADIVCFPESCVHKKLSFHKNHKFIDEIRKECKNNKIWAIVTEDIEIRGKVYNASLLINRKGKIVGDYEKIHLYGDKVNPGRKVKVFNTDFGKIGIAICWDLAFPELFKKMKKEGAKIIFCPSQWWYDSIAHEEKHQVRELEILESLVRVRAYENVCFVVLCNPVMDSKYQISYSAIVSPTKILSKIVEREGLITSKINLSEIKKLEEHYRD